jgi:hypothetical protein
MVASCLAAINGFRIASSSTAVPMPMREVRAATAESSVRDSCIGCHQRMWSDTHRWVRGESSAAPTRSRR